jgi:LEA14-like dessication related protein
VMLKRVCLFLVLLGVGAGSLFCLPLETEIAISLEEKQIQGLGPKGLTLVFYVNLTNSSSKTYYLSSYNYRFVVNQKEYFRLNTPLESGLRVEAAKKTLLALPVRITYELLFQTVDEIEGLDMLSCYMMGEMVFSDERGKKKGELPFAFNGEIPLFREPRIQFSDLSIKALSIGGADLDFKIMLVNENGFSLGIERIRYDLKFGEHQVKKGQILGEKSIDAHGEEIFSVPLLLDFFDTGQDLRELLQKSHLDCRFEGEVEILTIWGRVVVPFDVTSQIKTTRMAQ